MANVCIISVGNTKTDSGSKLWNCLSKQLGNDHFKVNRVWNACVDIKEGRATLIQALNKKLGDVEDLSNVDDVALTRAALDYYIDKHPNISWAAEWRKTISNEHIRDYASPKDRNLGMHFAANVILNVQKDAIKSKAKLNLKVVIGRLVQGWNNYVFTAIANKTNKDFHKLDEDNRQKIIDDIKAEYMAATDKEAWFNDKFPIADRTASERNIIAVWKELHGSKQERMAYINEVFNDNRLMDVYNQIKADAKEPEADKLSDRNSEDPETGEDGQEKEGDIEDPGLAAFDHSGSLPSVMKHLTPRLLNYLNTLEQQVDKSSGITTKNTSNSFGIADTMDARRCTNMLYSAADTNHGINGFISSIRTIAKGVDGFAAFKQLANDLETDNDFAHEMFTVFSKTIVSKVEVAIGESAELAYSNLNNNANTAMINECLTNLRATTYDISVEDTVFALNKIPHDDNFISNKSELNGAIHSLYDIVKNILPNVAESAITGYVYNNLNNSELAVAISRFDYIRSTIRNIVNDSATTKQNYAQLIAKDKQERAQNAYIREQIENKNAKYSAKNLIDTTKNYEIDYLADGVKKQVINLANALAPYSVIQLTLTSRNSAGNLSSDVINNSRITRLKRMLECTKVDEKGNKTNPVLEDWGNKKLKSPQYKYNTLLVSQYNSKHEKISHGIFKFDEKSNKYVLEDDFEHILEIGIFNGVVDFNSDNNKLYSKMTFGDFAPTSFAVYFNSHAQRSSDDDSDHASYFTRTPSDAPKIFILRGRRIETKYDGRRRALMENNADEIIASSLSKFEIHNLNQEEADILNNENIARMRYTEKDTLDSNVASDNAGSNEVYISKKDLVKAITHNTGYRVPTENGLHINEEDGTATYQFIITNDNNPETPETLVTIKGSYNKWGDHTYLHNIEVTSMARTKVVDYHNTDYSFIYDAINYAIEHGKTSILGVDIDKVKYTVNKEHDAFEILRQQFKQEMIDAANALAHYFVTDASGRVMIEDGKPVARTDINKGYNWYHLIDGKLYETETDKTTKRSFVTLLGNVFHSNKFTTKKWVDKNGRRVLTKVNYLDDLIGRGKVFDFLYGGLNETAPTHLATVNRVERDKNDIEHTVVTDINFTKDQSKAVDDAIAEFLQDYIEYAKESVAPVKKFVDNVVETSDENIIDYAVNQLIMHYNYDGILEGNSKFYKDTQTILKRAKEYQGSGVPQGCNNISLMDKPNSLIEHSALNSDEKFQALLKQYGISVQPRRVDVIGEDGKKTVDCAVTETNSFRAVTIKNSKDTDNEALQQILNKLVNEGNVTREHAMDLLYGPIETDKEGKPVVDKQTNEPKRRGGFTDVKVNDAQSYITLDEFIRRVAIKGQLNKYKPLITRILDENVPLSSKDVDEFIQVQKNFYYDLWYDEQYGMEVPRQIKNAEFVLVPRLIKGTQLEQVYKAMKAANIQQLNTVETSKAANEDILTLWDNKGNLTKEVIDKFIADAQSAGHDYYYNNLYTQQETPQHMDSTNKAGIQLMKKIIDNLPDDQKKEFFQNYIANIYEDFSDLMEELEIPLDKHGNIDYDTLTNTLSNVNQDMLYTKLKEEMMRLGLDKNMLDYCTLDATTHEPIMPAFMGSITKFESICQSMFNKSITRQKLPGFHAAQVTAIGWRSYYKDRLDIYVNKKDPNDRLTKEKFDALDDKAKRQYKNVSITHTKDLKYHPEGKGYIEVMVPMSYLGIKRDDPHYKGMTLGDILAELEKDGLDTIIGYRIPTEGKQSICNMKIVGLLPNELGSTIIVPNGWVAQTGSDFDIDSVYAVQFSTYRDANGRLRKHKYVDSTSKDVDIRGAWAKYIQNHLTKAEAIEAKHNATEYINGKIQEHKDHFKAERDEFKENERLAFNTLVDALHKSAAYSKEDIDAFFDKIAQVDADIKQQAEDENWNSAKRYAEQLRKYEEVIKPLRLKDASLLPYAQQYVKEANVIINSISGNTNSLGSLITDDKIDYWNDIAKKHDLMSFDDYKKALNTNTATCNTRDARNNKILQSMIDILLDPKNLEENVSRSNFDHITYERNQIMSDDTANERKWRSPYDVFDQMHYQEDAMSGANLKGMSVSMDNMCSVCNTVKPVLSSPIKVVYDKEDLDAKTVKGRYKTKTTANGIQVEHDKYGWTPDNKNVSGYILTAYSSETTAFILDAIKEGAIPNVNEYSFGVLKTLVNSGINYKAALSFIMSPGVERIVNAYNAKNSIYVSDNTDPVAGAIEQIGIALGVVIDNNNRYSIDKMLKNISEKYAKDFNKIFGTEDDKEISVKRNIPLLVSKQIDRIKERNEFADTTPVGETHKLLFDLGTVLAFNKIKRQADEIGNIARCLNPDKFGAKQSVFATNDIFRTMFDAMMHYNDDVNLIDSDLSDAEVKEKRRPALMVKDKHILDAVYPNISTAQNVNDVVNIILRSPDFEKTSAYPPMAAFIKYASATSVLVSRSIIPTQRPGFRDAVYNVKSVFTNPLKPITEERYNDFQHYLLNYLYQNVPVISHAISYTINDDGSLSLNIDPSSDVDAERKRVYGYSRQANLKVKETETALDAEGKEVSTDHYREVKVGSITHPTQEQIDRFAKFSPAQKIKWMTRYCEDAGLLSLYHVELHNGKNRGSKMGQQTIEFADENVDANTILDMFKDLLDSNIPFAKMTAVDLVKYAFQVEGFKMRNRGITRTISNSILVNPFAENGLEIVSRLTDQFNSIGATIDDINTVYERYLRARPNIPEVKTSYLTDDIKKVAGCIPVSYSGAIRISQTSFTGVDNKDADAQYNNVLKRLGIINSADSETHNPYIRLKSGYGANTKRVLYKVRAIGQREYMLTPLSPLTSNECSDTSCNDDNNLVCRTSEYYDLLYNYYTQHREEQNLDIASANYAKEQATRSWAKKVTYEDKVVEFNLQEDAKTNNKSVILLDEIKKHFPNVADIHGVPLPLYSTNERLQQLMYKNVPNYQKIKFGGKTHYYKIQKIGKVSTEINRINKQLGEDNDRAKVQQIVDDINQMVADNPDNTEAVVTLLRSSKDNLKHAIADSKLGNGISVIMNYQNRVPVYRIEELTKEQYVEATEPSDDSTLFSNTIETSASVATFAKSLRDNSNDEISLKFVENLRSNGIDIREILNKSPEKVGTETRKILTRETSAFVIKKAKQLKDRVRYFIKDPNDPDGDAYLTVTDPIVLDMVRTNPTVSEAYLRLYNDIQALSDLVQQYSQVTFTNEDDDTVKFYIDKIVECNDTIISKLPIADMIHNYNEMVVSKMSTNPLIKEDLINICDGYYGNNGLAWAFNDVMESGNPLVQNIMKDVMGDIEARRVSMHRIIKEHRAHIKDIQDRARKAGLSVDLHKIIKNGRFVVPYTEDFKNLYDELRQAVIDAETEFGKGSVEHLKAKNNYDYFKAIHVNQPAKQDYYIEKALQDRNMLETYPKAFAAYQKLKMEQYEILSNLSAAGLTQDQQDRINEINAEINNLTSEVYFYKNGVKTRRLNHVEGVHYSDEDLAEMEVYGEDAADALSMYRSAIGELNDKYFKYDAVFGFEEQLRKCLSTVEAFEDRDANGIPTRPYTELYKIEAYRDAKDWLAANAKFEFEYDEEIPVGREGHRVTLGEQLTMALSVLRLGAKGRSVRVSDIMRTANKGKGIYDENGLINASLLTDEELDKIKQATEEAYYKDMYPVGCDLLLMNSYPQSHSYNDEFYENLTGGAVRRKSLQYIQTVTKINRILEDYYDRVNNVIDFSRIPDTDEGTKTILELFDLYKELKQYKTKGSKETAEFIAEECESDPNTTEFDRQMQLAASRKNVLITTGPDGKPAKVDARLALQSLLYDVDEEGNFTVDKNGQRIPNKLIFTTIRPKAEFKAKYDNSVKEAAVELVNHYFRSVKTPYYYSAASEARKNGTYAEWFNKNHVYNPYTREFEPLQCWTHRELKYDEIEGLNHQGHWVPKSTSRVRVVKDGNVELSAGNTVHIEAMDMRNPDYKEGRGNLDNYRVGSANGQYDQKLGLNEYEIEMMNYLKETLMSTANTATAQQYFDHGYLPAKYSGKVQGKSMAEWARYAGLKLAQTFGMDFSGDHTAANKDFYDDIAYKTDITPDMPMLHNLKSNKPVTFKTAEEATEENLNKALNSEESIEYKVPTPRREEFENQSDYELAIKQHRENNRKVREHNEHISNKLADNDYLSVIEDYIQAASRFNGIQQNKLKLYYLLDQIRHQQVYKQSLGFAGDLSTNSKLGTKENPYYNTRIDDGLVKQIETFIRRMAYDQWKEPNVLGGIMRNLQGFTSANYMMMNIRGGIANVTVGETGILAEAAASEYIDIKDYAFGNKHWIGSIIAFMRGIGKAESISLEDAITKVFKVVDYDELNYRPKGTHLDEWHQRLISAGYSPQSSGEHMMQNSVLFAMLHSHKIVALPNDPLGIGYTYMNKEEYVRYRQAELLENILDDNQKAELAKFKDSIKADKNTTKDYAWFRKDLLTEFVYYHCSDEQIKKFIDDRKAQRKQAIEEFDKMQDMFSQLELKDGFMSFKEDTDLGKLHEIIGENGYSAAERICALMAERVRKVNNKIHGVYNRMGAAQIEEKWYGAIIMQYHKHIPMGLLKRYRRRGYYNETRGTVEKGIWTSMEDFLRMNVRKSALKKNLTDDQTGAIEGLQNLFKAVLGAFDIAQIKTTWNIIPEYERANIRRGVGDLIGVMASVLGLIALLSLKDPDDDDSRLFNLALYECDKLTAESFMWNPLGAPTEIKTMFSSPISCTSIIKDAYTAVGLSCSMLLGDFDDDDLTYQTGRFAGRNKLGVYLERRTPIWNGIRNVVDISASNKAYKIGDSANTLFHTKDAAEYLRLNVFNNGPIPE